MRPAHGVRSPAPRLVLGRPGSGSSGVFAELLAGRPGSWKTRSAAGFFFLGFVFGGGGRGLLAGPWELRGGTHRDDGATPRGVRGEDAREALERVAWGRNQDRDSRQELDGRHDQVGRAVPAWLLQSVGDAAVGQERAGARG